MRPKRSGASRASSRNAAGVRAAGRPRHLMVIASRRAPTNTAHRPGRRPRCHPMRSPRVSQAAATRVRLTRATLPTNEPSRRGGSPARDTRRLGAGGVHRALRTRIDPVRTRRTADARRGRRVRPLARSAHRLHGRGIGILVRICDCAHAGPRACHGLARARRTHGCRRPRGRGKGGHCRVAAAAVADFSLQRAELCARLERHSISRLPDGIDCMLPGTFLYTYYGKVVGDVAAVVAGTSPPRGPEYYVLLGMGLAATVAVTVIITRAARAALAQPGDR